MSKKLVIAVVLCIRCFIAFATQQMPDIITYNGKEYEIGFYVWPMEEYFRTFPEKRPISEPSSNLWRRYIAAFEIIQNELWVVDIKIIDDRDGMLRAINPDGTLRFRSVFNEIFSRAGRFKIDWFSGSLILPQYTRRELAELRLTNNDIEYYIKIDIKNGIVHNESIMGKEQYIEYQRERFENRIEFIPNGGYLIPQSF